MTTVTYDYATVTEDELRDLYVHHLADPNPRGPWSKNAIERTFFNDPRSHGKTITRLWRKLGIETEQDHPLVIENEALRAMLSRVMQDIESNGYLDGRVRLEAASLIAPVSEW